MPLVVDELMDEGPVVVDEDEEVAVVDAKAIVFASKD